MELPANASIAPASIYRIVHSSAAPALLNAADFIYGNLSNGDDGFALVEGSPTDFVILDIIGDWNGDPGSGWDVAGTTNATQKSFGSLELFTKSKNPSLFFVRFVDSNYWHEIVYYEWKYFVPIQHLLYVYQTQSIKYRFSIGNNVKLLIFCHISSTFLIGLKETDMLEGIENREECMNKLLKQSNCSETCAPLVFNFLKFEQCKEPEDYLCMWNHSKSVKQEMYETCFQNSFITQYPSKFLRGASGVAKPYFGSVAISFDYISPRVELSTERYIIGVTDFIGSVGGSLGLFLGFSIFTYTSDMIDGILQKFKV